MSPLFRFAVVVAIAFHPPTAKAHESRPLYVEITEQHAAVFSVQWKPPPSVPSANSPDIILPESCTRIGPERRANDVHLRNYECPSGLAGQRVRIAYAVINPSVSTLMRVSWLSGQTHTIVSTPDETTIEIPAKESLGGVAGEYLALGVEHILKGIDHLLFVACLLLIAGTARRILITITGFTLAHSVTLALSALGLIRVPVAPVEAAIALSIVFLAVEIARDRRDTLTYRYPIAVSVSFGLLHGFGFAAVLGEAGLPQTEIPAALLFFNVGVELGQVLFVVAVVVGFRILQTLARRLTRRDIVLPGWERAAAYVTGTLAAFWIFERVAAFWS